jgi:hypothetical protein
VLVAWRTMATGDMMPASQPNAYLSAAGLLMPEPIVHYAPMLAANLSRAAFPSEIYLSNVLG